MQNDFITGSLGSPKAAAIVYPAADRISHHRGKIFATLDTHFDDYLTTAEGKALPIPHCIQGTRGHSLAAPIAAALSGKDCTMVEKHTFGSFELARLIKEACEGERFSIELIGLCTDICVVSNAIILKAAFPEVSISVNANLCAGVTPQLHDAALATMRSCQIDIIK